MWVCFMLNTRQLILIGKKTVAMGFHSLLELNMFTSETVGSAWSWVSQHRNCSVAASLLYLSVQYFSKAQIY